MISLTPASTKILKNRTACIWSSVILSIHFLLRASLICPSPDCLLLMPLSSPSISSHLTIFLKWQLPSLLLNEFSSQGPFLITQFLGITSKSFPLLNLTFKLMTAAYSNFFSSLSIFYWLCYYNCPSIFLPFILLLPAPSHPPASPPPHPHPRLFHVYGLYM